jgi:DNA-binding LytR/AlgR family response regulator
MNEYIYTYVLIDDEEIFRNQVMQLIAEFNESEQLHFVRTYNCRIRLNLLAEYERFENSTPGDMNQADIVFLDLRFDDIPAGIETMRGKNNAELKKIIVLTAYKEDYEKRAKEFPRVLSWLHKPLTTNNLEDCLHLFHIRKNNIRTIFEEEKVTITVGNHEPIFYSDIICVKSGGQEVNIFLKNGIQRTLSANMVSVEKFDGKGNLRRISPSCAINIGLNWTPENSEGIGLYVNLQTFKQLPAHELRITNLFQKIIPVLYRSIDQRIA